jgi:hypothetical protein
MSEVAKTEPQLNEDQKMLHALWELTEKLPLDGPTRDRTRAVANHLLTKLATPSTEAPLKKVAGQKKTATKKK